MNQQAHPYDFPPAAHIEAAEVYGDLIANRFERARWAVRSWSTRNRARQLVEAGQYQEAICRLERSNPGLPLAAQGFAAGRRL